jgi:hypothetical protein
MVKAFGWEQKMSERVAEKRAEEVQWIMACELANLLNDFTKCAFIYSNCLPELKLPQFHHSHPRHDRVVRDFRKLALQNLFGRILTCFLRLDRRYETRFDSYDVLICWLSWLTTM